MQAISTLAQQPESAVSAQSRKAREVVRTATSKLIESLKAGQSETLKQYLDAIARFRTYSLHNVLLIKYQRPDATRVAGYRKWREFGRQVKLGAKGILILAPIFKRAAKNGCEEEDSMPVITYRGVYVFDVSDTQGTPLPEFVKTQ